MSQQDELASVKARIKALAARTVSRGCTEAEAMAAAEMVGRLLERYALSMDEVELREQACVQEIIRTGAVRRRAIDACIPSIARFCDCKAWFTRDGEGEGIYVVFGFAADVAMATYLAAVIGRAVANGVGAFKAENAKLRGAAMRKGVQLRRASASFQRGMVSRISHRLDAMRDERDIAVRAQAVAATAGGTALVVAKLRSVEAAFRETGVRLVAGRTRMVRHNAAAWARGYAAGGTVDLGRPLQGGARRLIG